MTARGRSAWGAAALVALAWPSDRAAADAGRERVELSAAILPAVLKLYAYEGTNYPAGADARLEVAREVSLVFEELLVECAAHYPGIVVSGGDGAELTSEQLSANYDLVAQCSYERHTAKPYWIPALVDDVEICGTVLGGAWRLLHEDDVDSFTEEDFQFFADTLTGRGWGGEFYSLLVYVRGRDGTLKQASLYPGASPRVSALPVSGEAARNHLEGMWALRCIRRSIVL